MQTHPKHLFLPPGNKGKPGFYYRGYNMEPDPILAMKVMAKWVTGYLFKREVSDLKTSMKNN